MRILITGSTGLLGQALHARFESTHDLWGVSRRACQHPQWIQCDLGDRAAVLRHATQMQPEVIMHTAAQSNVDTCERDPASADAGNVVSTQHVVAAAEACGARVVHISTDYVFDGMKGAPYVESDVPAPVNYYGRTKLTAESTVQGGKTPWLIVRPSTLFGPGRSTFIDAVTAAIVSRKVISVFVDQVTSPSYTPDIAEAVDRLLAADATGIVHVANDYGASRAEVARAVVAMCGGASSTLRTVRMADVSLPARRPPNSSLDISRLQELTGWRPDTWQHAVRRHLTWTKHIRH